jgi:hypothetical protein
MTLVADNQSVEIENITNTELNAALGRWRYCCPSVILHHGKSCCTNAREWLFSTDHSQLSGQHRLTGPRWLRKRYEWGPSQWPMTWCHAIEQEDGLDCGALAALSREIFTARDVACYPVQLIQQYSEDTTIHWASKWTDHPASTHWIQGALIYHEACAVEIGLNQISIWDPSAGWWANPKQSGGYGSILAVRLKTDDAEVRELTWGEHRIAAGEWQRIQTRCDSGKTNLLQPTTDTLTSVGSFATLQTKTDAPSGREIQPYTAT